MIKFILFLGNVLDDIESDAGDDINTDDSSNSYVADVNGVGDSGNTINSDHYDDEMKPLEENTRM